MEQEKKGITIKLYAESKHVSYEAVRQQIHRFKTDLEGHVTRINRNVYLDEYAVAFLDTHRASREIVVQNADKQAQELIKKQEEQIQALKDQLLKATMEKSKYQEIAEGKTASIMLLEQKNKELEDQQDKTQKQVIEMQKAIDQAEAEADQKKAELEETRKKLTEAERIINRNKKTIIGRFLLNWK